MDPGKLKHQLVLQERSTTQDAAGQESGAWSTVATVRAAILVPSGIETVRAGAEATVGRLSVRIRRRSGIHASMRFLHGSVVYNILSVPPTNNDPRFIELPCEVVNAAV